MFDHTISAILRGKWMLDRNWAYDHLPLVTLMLKGGTVSFVDRTGNAKEEMPFAIDPKTMNRYDLYIYDPPSGNMVPNINIPQGSVGIISFNGPITKYNGSCGDPGTIAKASSLLDMQKRACISAIVQILDTPGGEVRASNNYIQLAQSSNKPIVSFVDDMCASLGVWFSSVSTETYFSHPLCELGSIGAYCTLLDFRGKLEKDGIKIHEIYAPQSVDKNKDVKDAFEGNYAAFEADLQLHVAAFIDFVKTNMGDKAASNVDKWSTGKMFYAEDAIKMGLAHGIKPLHQVVSKAAWLAKKNKN